MSEPLDGLCGGCFNDTQDCTCAAIKPTSPSPDVDFETALERYGDKWESYGEKIDNLSTTTWMRIEREMEAMKQDILEKHQLALTRAREEGIKEGVAEAHQYKEDLIAELEAKLARAREDERKKIANDVRHLEIPASCRYMQRDAGLCYEGTTLGFIARSILSPPETTTDK